MGVFSPPGKPAEAPLPRQPGERAKPSPLPPLLPSPLWEPPPRPPGLDPAIWDEMVEAARFGRVRIELWGGQRVAIFDPVPGGRWWGVFSADARAIELAEEALERLAMLAERDGKGSEG